MEDRKEYMYGKTKIVIVSPLVNMSYQEQYEWFESEWEKENPILIDIFEAAMECARHSTRIN